MQKLDKLYELLDKDKSLGIMREQLIKCGRVNVVGLCIPALAYILSWLKTYLKKYLFLVITPTEEIAEDIYNDINCFSNNNHIFLFRGAKIIDLVCFQEEEILNSRLSILLNLSSKKENNIFIVSSISSILQKVPTLEVFKLSIGDEISKERLIDKLVKLGYKFGSQILRGGFCTRGMVVDIFPFGSRDPIRIEIHYDKIYSIRYFDIVTQISKKNINDISIPFINLKEFKKTLFDYLPQQYDNTVVVLQEPKDFKNAIYSSHQNLTISYEDFKAYTKNYLNITSSILPNYSTDREDSFVFKTHLQTKLKNIKELILKLKEWHKKYKIIFMSSDTQRLFNLFREYNLDLKSRVMMVVEDINLSSGFILEDIGLIMLKEDELFTRRKASNLSSLGIPQKNACTKNLLEEEDIEIGDYIVHRQYGIGIYRGIVNKEVEKKRRDYILIEYADSDKLYLPIENADLVHKYINFSNKKPRLNRLCEVSWKLIKKRVYNSVEKYAKELLELYAARSLVKKERYCEDTSLQYEFELSFPHIETNSQRLATLQVKKDLLLPKPMDRLLCGDVGYGKTEVAMRAAFKAVTEGRQVAVLCPTTILAQQHYNNFVSRFSPWGVNITHLSRLLPKKLLDLYIQDIKKGKIDIIIGTHKLLSDKVLFKNLGLVIIDDEHKFGVMAKEKLKKIRLSVDVLSMTATPIPRTLQMALSGIRDITVMESSIPGRLPVKTYLIPNKKEIIREAILKEVGRGGQVYFVHNRIKTIYKRLKELESIVGQVRIEVAHSKINPSSLKKIMQDFYERRFDVLLTTSIIEAGIDIPSVNTIIVDDAHLLGLGQLHQLRGRVGRTSQQAYAYFIYPDKISQAAKERLSILHKFSSLGDGFNIAMKDLQLRGAGKLLSTQQHGNIHDVGFELYIDLLKSAIFNIKNNSRSITNNKIQEEEPTYISFYDVEYYIPKWFIAEDKDRFLLYKKLASVNSISELKEIKRYTEDKYGKLLPQSMINLFDLLEIKIISKELSIASIIAKSDKIYIKFKDNRVIILNFKNNNLINSLKLRLINLKKER